MTNTPHLDAAYRAGCPWYTCEVPNCQPECGNYRISALEILRAALPWDLPAERLEAMARGAFRVVGDRVPPGYIRAVLAAYRADPIVRELYPEKF